MKIKEGFLNDEVRMQPHNVEAEEGLLAACLIDGSREIMAECIEANLTPYFFFKTSHQEIFRALLSLYETGDPIDEILLLDYLRKNGTEVEVGGIAAIYAIQNRIETPAHARFFMRIVHENHLLRRLIRTSRETIEACYNSSKELPEIIDQLESEARNLVDSATAKTEIHTSGEIVATEIMELDKRIQSPEKTSARVRTQLNKLNEVLPRKGLLPGHVTVLAARPSIGKTSLAMNIVEQVSVIDRVPSLVVSLEMTPSELINRMACSRSRVNSKDVDDGTMFNGDETRLKNAYREIQNAPIYIDGTATNTISTIQAKARNLANKIARGGDSLGLVVIDYLQLITGVNSRAPREQQISEICRGVKLLAKELNVPVIVLSQLNRALEKENREPRLSDLRESGSIEQDADEVLLLHRPPNGEANVPNTPNEETIKIIHAKIRNGPIGDFLTTFQRPFTRFINYEDSSE